MKMSELARPVKIKATTMKGYKAFDENLKCMDFQYEIGKEYEIEGELRLCQNGFHFCENIADCYTFYPAKEYTRICEVEASGEIITNDMKKFCASKIKILSEITDERKRCNIYDSSTGYLNVGPDNSGNQNVGRNNVGSGNTGNFNSGNLNSGTSNIGNFNSGSGNLGNYNTGHNNSGNFNVGNGNRGSYNNGRGNLGYYNSGSYNLSNGNSGIFNTENHYMMIFDKESTWTMDDWENSFAARVLDNMPTATFMTKSEFFAAKDNNGYFRYTGNGFVESDFSLWKRRQKWWDEELLDEDREYIRSIPNFDAQKFYMCTGIIVDNSVDPSIMVPDQEDF